MIIIAADKKKCIEEFEKELNRDSGKTYTIYIDDGLKHSIIINNDFIVKRTYLTDKDNAIDTLIKAFEILPDELLYCLNDKAHGITIDIRKEEKEVKEKDYYELELPDITVTPDDMEAFSANVAKHFKKDIAEHMGMNPLIGIDFMNAVTSASAYGFDYAVELLTNRIFEKAKKPEIKPKKMTAENKIKLLQMIDIIPVKKDDFVAHPTPEELKTMQVTLTYDELAELIEELFSIG